MWERWVETGTDCYIDSSSSLDYSSTSFASWQGLLNRGSLKAQPSASWFSLWHSCLNWLTASGTLSIFFLNVHLLPLFFGLFTQVHLLIDGSVEGQCITWRVLPGTVEQKNDGWLQLEYQKGLNKLDNQERKFFSINLVYEGFISAFSLSNDLMKILVSLGIFNCVIFKDLGFVIAKIQFLNKLTNTCWFKYEFSIRIQTNKYRYAYWEIVFLYDFTLRNIAIDQYHIYRKQILKNAIFFFIIQKWNISIQQKR